MYTWRQDNATVTCAIAVPARTKHSQLKLLLTRRRFTLALTGSGPLLRRQLLAPIVPRRSRAYTMHVPDDGDGPPEVRIVLFKERVAGWSSLFAGDARGQQLCKALRGEPDPDDGLGASADGESWPGEEDPSRDAVSMPRLRQTWRRPNSHGDGGGRITEMAACISLSGGLEESCLRVVRSAQYDAPGARQSWRPAVRKPREGHSVGGASVATTVQLSGAVHAPEPPGRKKKKPKKVPAYA